MSVEQLIQSKISSLPPDQAVVVMRNLLAEQYRKDLFALAKYGLHYSDMTYYTHGEICEALMEPTRRKLIVVPRGCFKSSIAVVAYSIFLLINNPNLRILIDSELYTNSKNFLREIKSHLESPKMISLFGTFETDWNWNEGEITIAQRTKVLKEASITVGGIGTTKVGQHYDVIIGDDYNSNLNSAITEGRKKIIDHYRYNQSILEPNGIYVLVATRYAADDVTGHVLKNEIGINDIEKELLT